MGECREQSSNWLQMSVSKLHYQYLFHIFPEAVWTQDFLFYTVLSYLSVVVCCENFTLVRCALDDFLFILYRLAYKLTIKRSNVVFLLKKPISCHSALGAT